MHTLLGKDSRTENNATLVLEKELRGGELKESFLLTIQRPVLAKTYSLTGISAKHDYPRLTAAFNVFCCKDLHVQKLIAFEGAGELSEDKRLVLPAPSWEN